MPSGMVGKVSNGLDEMLWKVWSTCSCSCEQESNKVVCVTFVGMCSKVVIRTETLTKFYFDIQKRAII